MTAFARAARAVADLTQGTIIAVVEIEAPPERVFEALTDSQQVVQWWGSVETYQTTEWTSDFRVGGQWRSAGRSADGSTFSVSGEFLEIDRPKKIVQTWVAPWDGGNTTTIRYQLDPIANGTRVTVRHEGFGDRRESCAQHTSGWELVLGWLARFVTPPPANNSKYFLIRLLGPRPTFPYDMSATEATVMREHGMYWRGLAAKDVAIVFGPVADPKGPWGVGIVQVTNEAEVKTLEAADPAILSELGFRYEILPMLQAVTRP